ncbi:MAG: single-stranded DNA-binding protein [Clostridia bacterium]|nr:single-stranded DNA-binding protein [Clostridia bacterium]
MLNKVILMGRLTKKPLIEATPSGVSVTKFTLAVDRNYVKQGEERYADFISCVAWRGTAEFICKYFDKGQLMALVGSIQTRSWDDNEGKRHYATEVVADEVYFAGSKINNSSEAAENAGQSEPISLEYFAKRGFGPKPDVGDDNKNAPDFKETNDDDDLPF